jgi:23S rRNA pseudouridine1911/1915/1917 synthase
VHNNSSIISTDPQAPAPDESDFHEAEGVVESETRRLKVDAPGHGERLDRVLAGHITEFSRNYLKQLIEEGAVQLNAKLCTKPAQRLRAGDEIDIELRPTQQSQAFVPEVMDLAVVYEDADLLVIEKPAGLVVHPAAGNWRGTLLNGLLARHKEASELPRAGIVHRLDKDTSGLMVVAKSRQAMDQLVKQIAAREVRRQYLALAHRPWVGVTPRVVETGIGRDVRNRLRMGVVDAEKGHGKEAKTTLELVQNAAEGCLVLARLHTGRTHQIRVHMSYIGHPLVADGIYGGAAAAGMTRHALHAWRLGLTHPILGEELSFECAPPPDFLGACALWNVRVP